MKVGIVTRSNKKGQIVIPKEYREVLGIDDGKPLNLILRGDGIYIYPVEELIAKAKSENSFIKILEKTQGKWADDDWGKTRRSRRRAELAASQRRRQTW